MSIFTSLWFWVLILGILLTIAGIIAWAVTGNADVLVGILLGAGVGWIIGGLLIWIFGRQKKPEVPPVPSMPPGTLGAPSTTFPSTSTFPSTMSSTYPSATMATYPGLQQTTTPPVQTGTSQYMPTNPSASTMPSSMSTSQQQLMQLLQSNPQLLNSYSGSPKF